MLFFCDLKTDARKGHVWNGCTQGSFDAHNQKGHCDGCQCTQRTFEQRMRTRYGANPGYTQPTSRMHATPLILNEHVVSRCGCYWLVIGYYVLRHLLAILLHLKLLEPPAEGKSIEFPLKHAILADCTIITYTYYYWLLLDVTGLKRTRRTSVSPG